jgi:hypothetical protein
MNRPLSLVLIAACLSAGCTTTPEREANALASEIMRGPSPSLTCSSGEVPHCLTTGSRIFGMNQPVSCECQVPAVGNRYLY